MAHLEAVDHEVFRVVEPVLGLAGASALVSAAPALVAVGDLLRVRVHGLEPLPHVSAWAVEVCVSSSLLRGRGVVAVRQGNQ